MTICNTCLQSGSLCNCGEALTRSWLDKLSTRDMRKLARILADELAKRVTGDAVMGAVVDEVHAAISEQPAADYTKAIDDFEQRPEPFDGGML